MEAAIIAVAGSAVPKMKRSTVVAMVWWIALDLFGLWKRGGRRGRTVVVSDHVDGLDFEKGHDARAVARGVLVRVRQGGENGCRVWLT